MVATLQDLSNHQLAILFNAVTGQTVAKFTNRSIGVNRVEKALQATNTDLDDAMDLAGLLVREETATRPAKRSKGRTRARKGDAGAPKRTGGRLEEVLGLLRRDDGATVAEIMKVTGWQPHTTRAYLSKGGAAGKAATIMVEKAAMRDGKKTTVYRVR